MVSAQADPEQGSNSRTDEGAKRIGRRVAVSRADSLSDPLNAIQRPALNSADAKEKGAGKLRFHAKVA